MRERLVFMNLKKRGWTLSLAILLLLSLFMPDTSAAVDYKNIRVRISMSSDSIKSTQVVLNGDYALLQDSALALPQGAYTIKVEADGASLRLTGNGIDRVVGPEIRFIRLKYSSTAVSTLRVVGTKYEVDAKRVVNYLGDMRFHVAAGSIFVTNHVPLEEYLYGVVAYEMSNSFPVEALKAQAVAARGYAIRKIDASQGRDYDILDTTNDQVYKGFELSSERPNDPKYTNVVNAVNGTKGQVVTYNGKIAETYYAASNGGQTDLVSNVWPSSTVDKDALYPYLVMKDDEYDLRNQSSWTEEFFVPKIVDGSKDQAIVSNHTSEYIVRIANLTSGSLRVRSGPSTSYSIVGTAELGDVYEWVDSTVNEINETWHKIKYPSSDNYVEGYVRSDFAEKVLNGRFIYENPVLVDLQLNVYQKLVAGGDVISPRHIKIHSVTSLVPGIERWPGTGSRSYVSAVANLTLQYEKTDNTMSDIIDVKDVSINLMNKNSDGKYIYSHHYLNGNLRMRGVRTAVVDGQEGFEITNARFGHGLGMSQRGAQQMAVEGKRYDEILAFYYVGTSLKNYETGVPVLPDRGDLPLPTNPVPTITSTIHKIGANSVSGVEEKTAVEAFLSSFSVNNGSVVLVNSNNQSKTTGMVATGDVLHVKDTAGSIVKSYSIVIYGDVNGDGTVGIADLLGVQRHLLDVKRLSGANQSAADVNKDGKVSIADLLGTQRHLLALTKIAQ